MQLGEYADVTFMMTEGQNLYPNVINRCQNIQEAVTTFYMWPLQFAKLWDTHVYTPHLKGYNLLSYL